MNNKRERQRLRDLFSNMEVLVVNPAGNTPQIHPNSESLPFQIEDPEKPLLEFKNGVFEMASEPIGYPEVEQYNSDEIILHDKMEAIRDLTSPIPDISDVMPS